MYHLRYQDHAVTISSHNLADFYTKIKSHVSVKDRSTMSALLIKLKDKNIPPEHIKELALLIEPEVYPFCVEFMSSQSWFNKSFPSFVRDDIDLKKTIYRPDKKTRSLERGLLLTAMVFNLELLNLWPEHIKPNFERLLKNKAFLKKNINRFTNTNLLAIINSGIIDKTTLINGLIECGGSKISIVLEQQKLSQAIAQSEIKKVYKL